VIWSSLHLILYEVPHCNFHHIDSLEHWTNLGGYILMEPLLFMALDHFMEFFGWGFSLLLGWMIMLASLIVFSHVLSLLIMLWLHV
jgi:hypothetical protein